MTRGSAIMTESERVHALLRHEKPDRTPIYGMCGGFVMVYTQCSIADYYNKPDVYIPRVRKTTQDFAWISIPILGYGNYGGWEFGGEIKWPYGEFDQAPMLTRHPVETEEDIWSLEVPTVETAGIVPLMIEFNKLAMQDTSDNKPFGVAASLQGPFATACNISPPEKFLKWIIKNPDAAHRLMRLATDHQIDLARYNADTFGTKGNIAFIACPTSNNQLISPKHFEDFVLPYQKELNEKILEMGYKHIFMHICGEHNKNLPYWTQMPMGDPGIVSFGHEIQLETAAKYFPNDIIMGNLEPAILQTGTSDEVYKATKSVVEEGKKCPGGYIFAPGCELPPMAALDNIQAMNEAVNDFG